MSGEEGERSPGEDPKPNPVTWLPERASILERAISLLLKYLVIGPLISYNRGILP